VFLSKIAQHHVPQAAQVLFFFAMLEKGTRHAEVMRSHHISGIMLTKWIQAGDKIKGNVLAGAEEPRMPGISITPYRPWSIRLIMQSLHCLHSDNQ